jgi:hypothetical protein
MGQWEEYQCQDRRQSGQGSHQPFSPNILRIVKAWSNQSNFGFKIALWWHVQLRITAVILSQFWPHKMHHVPPKHSVIKTKARARRQAHKSKEDKEPYTLTFHQTWSFCSHYKCTDLHSIHINELYKIQLREKNWQFAFECKVLLLSFCFIKHHDIKTDVRTEGNVGSI